MRKLNTVLELLFLILETTIFPPSMRIGYTFSELREVVQEEFQDHVLRQEKTLNQLSISTFLLAQGAMAKIYKVGYMCNPALTKIIVRPLPKVEL